MSDYTKTTNFTAKDALSTGDPNKLIKGSLFDTEFDAIATAVTSKYDSNDIASEVTAEALTSNTTLLTPLRLDNVFKDNAGMISDIQALVDPNADTLLGWDDSAGAAIGFTIGAGLETSGTTLQLPSTLGGDGIDLTAGVLNVGAGNGITVGGSNVNIADVTASTTLPISITSGTFAFDMSSLTEIAIEDVNQAGDKFLVWDASATAPKAMPYDEAGIIVRTVTGTADTLSLTDMNTFIEYTNASDVTVTLNSATGAVGNIVLIKQTGAGTVTIAGTATIESSSSLVATQAVDSVIALVCIASGVWACFGERG